MRCVLYRAAVKLRACRGRERPKQPKSKLFAKLAVELFVLNLIRAFVGVCGHVVPVLRVYGVFAMLDNTHAWFGVLLLAASFSSTRLFWMSNRLMSPTTDSSQKEERPWPTVSRSTRPSRRYADSSEGVVRCVLYRADVKLHACSGRERPEQPKSKLFAKPAVELFVLNLIRARRRRTGWTC